MQSPPSLLSVGLGLGPSVPLPTYTQPPKGPTATSSFTTTIANYGTQAQVRTHVRLCVRACMRVRACVRLDDATSRPLTAISAAGHQRVPTGPNRPGRLASVTFARLLPVLSLFLFFSNLSPVALLRDPLVRFSSCESVRFLFLLSPSLHYILSSLARSFLYIYSRFTWIIPRSRAIFQYLRKLRYDIFRKNARRRRGKEFIGVKIR